ncbi:MAG: hypothetical protein M3040_06330, partial [Bacteroidota bacterium]|nr:hypothetical protein [Bacteroidota bacterium]
MSAQAGTKTGCNFLYSGSQNTNTYKKQAFVLIFFAFIFIGKTFAATVTTQGSGNWSSTVPGLPWPGGVIPAAGSDIVIADGTTLTVDGNRSCNSIGFADQGPSANGTLSVNAGFTLTVATTVSCPIATVDIKVTATYNLSGLGTINCANLICNNTFKPSGSNTTVVTVISTISNMNVSGDLILNGTVNQGNKTNNGVFNLQTGTVTVGGAITTVDIANANTTTFDMVTGSASPTLILTNASPFKLMNKGTSPMNFNGAGATVNYASASAQTTQGKSGSLNTTYTNLTLSGGGAKSLSNGIIVNGTLSMQGAATVASFTPTYGPSATLEYKGSTAQTTSDVEYPPTGLSGAPLNLRIDNPLGVTLNDDKSVSGTLSFINGKITTGINTLSIGVAGTVTGAGPGKY